MPAAWATNPVTWVPIKAFYDSDQRRRSSEEIKLGTAWMDGTQHYGLNWIVDTGELYLSSSFRTKAGILGTIFEGVTGTLGGEFPGQLRAAVIAVIPTQVELEQCLAGWERAMHQPDGLTWLQRQLPDRDADPTH
jgi:hypothetical protein